MTLYGYSRDKSASQQFRPYGIYFGDVTRVVDNFQIWVRIPRIDPTAEFGPLPTTQPALVGNTAACMFTEDRTDEIVVVGVFRTPNMTSLIAGPVTVTGSMSITSNLNVNTQITAGAVAAFAYTGDGTGLSALNATSLTSGTVDPARLPAFSGDASSTAGTAALTLATVNANVGSFGAASTVPTFTVDGKGRLTAAGSVAVVAPAGTLTGTTLAANVTGSSLTSVGTLTGLTVSGDVAVNGGDVTTTSTTATLFNATATTLNLGGAATSLTLGAGAATTINLRGTTIDSNQATVGLLGTPTTLTVGGAATSMTLGAGVATTINLRGTTINSNQATVALFASPTTLTFGAAATSLTVGVAGSPVTFPGDIALNGGDLTTTSTTATLFNANATTLNVGQAATTISIGATTGTTTVRNALMVTGALTAGSLSTAGTISAAAIDITGAAINEQQTIQVTGSPTGGVFALSVLGTVVVLNRNSTVAQTQTAFDGAIGAGNAVVTGNTFPASTQTVTFQGAYAATNVPVMALIANAMTGGTSPSVTITTPTGGVGVLSSASISTAGNMSATRGVFGQVLTGPILSTVGTGNAFVVRTGDAFASGLVINASNHPSSERAGITLGNWVLGQDLNANGGLDFFIWNGATRIAIGADGGVGVGNLTAAAITASGLTTSAGLNLTANTGVNWPSWGGGFWMQDTSWIRFSKGIWTANQSIGTDATIDIGYGGGIDVNYKFRVNGNAWIASVGTGNRIEGRAGGMAWNTCAVSSNTGSGNAAFSLHPGVYAPVMGATSATGNAVYFRDGGFVAATGAVVSGSFVPESSRRWKKNINDLSPKSAGAAGLPITKVLSRLRPVSYESNALFTSLPTGRRLEALRRLNAYLERSGRERYVLPEHDCGVEGCIGDSETPCPAKRNSTVTRHGFIAEELYDILPDIVHLDGDGVPAGYSLEQLLAFAVAAVQELTERIEALEAAR